MDNRTCNQISRVPLTNQQKTVLNILKHGKKKSYSMVVNQLIEGHFKEWAKNNAIQELSKWMKCMGGEEHWFDAWKNLNIGERFWICDLHLENHPRFFFIETAIYRKSNTHWRFEVEFGAHYTKEFPNESWACEFTMIDEYARFSGIESYDIYCFHQFNKLSRYGRYLLSKLNKTKHPLSQECYPLWRGFIGNEIPYAQTLILPRPLEKKGEI